MTIPIAVLVPLFDVALIYTAPGHIDLWRSEWLIISIVLYMGAFFFGLFVQLPREAKMLAAMDATVRRDVHVALGGDHLGVDGVVAGELPGDLLTDPSVSWIRSSRITPANNGRLATANAQRNPNALVTTPATSGPNTNPRSPARRNAPTAVPRPSSPTMSASIAAGGTPA